MESDVPIESLAWDPARAVPEEDVGRLDDLVGSEGWGGPLVVSMPRTGSTLLGTLFLLVSDPPGSGRHVFERYVHEPVAPVYWENRGVADVVAGIGGRLTERDIVQESAYQFADKRIARWFLRQARSPVAFTIRDPQIAWPSRWRIMLEMRLAGDPPREERERIERALGDRDYRELGDLLTRAVHPPGNGWAALLSLIDLCDDEGIEYVIVDNQSFRGDPDAVLADLCERWGLVYDPAMTAWDDLGDAIPRVHMSDLASGPEYEWYYETTLSSRGGIIRTDRAPMSLERFPEALRARPPGRITIDRAVQWYRRLLQEAPLAGDS